MTENDNDDLATYQELTFDKIFHFIDGYNPLYDQPMKEGQAILSCSLPL